MKNSKGIILVSTIVIVLLGVFLGVKFMNKPKDKSSIATQNKDAINANEDKKDEQKDNFLSESLREEKKKQEQDKNEEKTSTKEDDKEEKKTSEKEEDKKTNNVEEKENDKEENNKKEESKTTSAKKVEVYDDKYTVKNGDTLFSISKQYFQKDNINKAISLIKEINKIDDIALLKTGDKLLIPTEDNFKSDKKTVRTKNKENSKGNLYKVKSGDTLIDIAKNEMNWCKDLDKAVKLIMENNNFKNANDLKADQKIYIPVQK